MAFVVNLIKLVIAAIEIYHIRKHKKQYNDTFATADERDKADPVPRMFRHIESMVGITELVWIVLVFSWRLNHLGQVCSGDLLTEQYNAPPAIIPIATFMDLGSGTILLMITKVLCGMLILAAIVGCCYFLVWLMQSNSRPTFGKIEDLESNRKGSNAINWKISLHYYINNRYYKYRFNNGWSLCK